ncbi:hypothetical protein BX661DRAFT_206360 [Kickxella alabastrina]|uniref:uncharacterized protein n=1 Tax=Kickxella alabastrina TaxID=61397 RepID=UPI00221FD949|nr:uncharacterized protein BX661DRAFT_206360 [Kickxella alabastrina]KAI7825573.1 hypothetical protein BX661DRAFT_206360 [Kickxella alabastrina]
MVAQRAHNCRLHLYIIYILLALVVGLPGSAAVIICGAQQFTSFTLYQDPLVLASGRFVPAHVSLLPGCTLDLDDMTARLTRKPAILDAAPMAVIVWEEAVSAGCYSYAQVAKLLNQDDISSVRGVVFGSTVNTDQLPFGSPIVEPLSELSSVSTTGLRHLTLTAASTARTLSAMSRAGATSSNPQNITFQLTAETNPWLALTKTPEYLAQKYAFMCVSILLILYTFWEIGLTLCTMDAWNRRILMYILAIAYLIVFTLLQPYATGDRASQMVVLVSWIFGYISFSLFVVAWGTMVETIHNQVTVLRHHSKVHYSATAVVSLSILLKLLAFAAQSYQLEVVVNMVLAFEIPAIFGVQTLLLTILIWSFLSRTFGIAISKHTKAAVHNLAVLCVIALLGCLCIVALSITLATPARYTLHGYMAVVVLYELAIFAALWVRDHARRTRHLYSQYEFYVDSKVEFIQHDALNSLHMPRTNSHVGLLENVELHVLPVDNSASREFTATRYSLTPPATNSIPALLSGPMGTIRQYSQFSGPTLFYLGVLIMARVGSILRTASPSLSAEMT